MNAVDAIVAGCLVPLAWAAIVSGLDDLVVDIAMVWQWLRRRLFLAPQLPQPQRSSPEKPVAILLPLWKEAAVVGEMIERNLASIRYDNYHLFAGVYPNDPGTMDVVRRAEGRHSNVHLAIVPHDGPTSKADCLNWIYQAMRAHEEACGGRFEMVVTHDAEDVIHPESLAWINVCSRHYDMIQVPVLPLPTPWRNFTHGVYCDEFAEFQLKDVPVRRLLGGFLPSNGVGTGYSRRALDMLAERDENRLFDPASLTEDYDCGLRLHALGFRQVFLPLRLGHGEPLATREYFPTRLRQAIRQRTRWVTGICLQSWEKYGWRGGAAVIYWFWRDRKGLLGNPLSLLGNAVCLWGLGTLAWSRLSGHPWGLRDFSPTPTESLLLGGALLMQAHRLAVRTTCCARLYGIAFAAGTPLRAVWSNWMNAIATLTAICRYLFARLSGKPLVWLKTEHTYPATETQPPQSVPTLEEFDPAAVRTEIIRALPRHVMGRWRIVPVGVSEGSLYLAATRPPTGDLYRELRSFTHLAVRVQVVRREVFEVLERRASPQRP